MRQSPTQAQAQLAVSCAKAIMNNSRRDEEANGRPQRRRNCGGKKSKARKRGGGGNGGNAKASYRDYRRGTGVDHKKKASNKDIELTQEQKEFQAEQRRIIKENLAEWEKNPPKRRHRK